MLNVKSKLADAVALRTYHRKFTIFWMLNIPVVMAVYAFASDTISRIASLFYLVLVSIITNMVGSLATWQAARLDVKRETQTVLEAETLEKQISLLIAPVVDVPVTTEQLKAAVADAMAKEKAKSPANG